MNNYLKVTWIGEGNPPSGIYEYGAGTDHPTIPRGILKHRQNSKNWDFEYVYANLQEQNKEYLSNPVWFYTKENDVKGDGENSLGNGVYFATSPEEVPSSGNIIEKGTIGDIYLFYYGDTPKEGQKVQNGIFDKETHNKRRIEGDTIRNCKVSLSWDRDGNVTLTSDPEGTSLSGLYALALSMGADTLAKSLVEFSYKTDGEMKLNSFDMFKDEGFCNFFRGKNFGWFCNSVLGAEGIGEVKEIIDDYYEMYADSDEAYNTIPDDIRSMTDEDWEKVNGINPAQDVPVNPVESIEDTSNEIEISEHLQEILDAPRKTREEQWEALKENPVDIPKGTRLSKSISAEGVSSGRAYLLGVSDEVMESIIMSMPPYLQDAMNEMFTSKGNLRYGQLRALSQQSAKEILTRHGRDLGIIKPNTKQIADFQNQAMYVLAQAITENNPELTLYNDPTGCPGFITRNFDYLGDMGVESEYIFTAMNKAVRDTFIRELAAAKGGESTATQDLLREINANPQTDIDISDPDVIAFMNSTVMGKVAEDPMFMQAVLKISEKTGKDTEDVQNTLLSRLQKNVKTALAIRSNSQNTATVKEGNYNRADNSLRSDIKTMSSSGVLLGLMAASNDNTEEMGMALAGKGFDKFTQAIFGDNIDFVADDWIQTEIDGISANVSMGMLHYMAPGLPFYEKDGNLMVSYNGKDVNFHAQPAEKQKEIRDEILSTAIEDLIQGMSSDRFLSNFLKKYQAGLNNGSNLDIQTMSAEDDAMHFTPRNFKDVDNRVYGVAKLAGSYMDGLDELKMAAGNNPQKVEELLIQKENELEGMKEEFLDLCNVSGPSRDILWEAAKDALKQSRPQMIKDIMSRSGKTNLARNLENLSMIPLAANIIAEGKDIDIERGLTGYFNSNIDLSSELGDIDPNLKFNGMVVTVDGQKHFIAKEARSTGFGDVVHLRKINNRLKVTTFEIKAKKEGEQRSHLSSATPWMDSLLKLAKNTDGIDVSKLRDVNIIYEGNQKNREIKYNADGKRRKARNENLGLGDTMKKNSTITKRRIGIPMVFNRKSATRKEVGPGLSVNLTKVMDFASAEGRGFASF